MKSKMWIVGLATLLAVAGVAAGTTIEEALAAAGDDQYVQVNGEAETPLNWSLTLDFLEPTPVAGYIWLYFMDTPVSTNFEVWSYNASGDWVTGPNKHWSWSGLFPIFSKGATRVVIRQRADTGLIGTVYLDAVTAGTGEPPGDMLASYYSHTGVATAFPETQEPTPIDIDIKPGSYPNSINLGSNGVVPVAILSTADFDATAIPPDRVFLAGAGVAVRGKGNNTLASSEDVNGDTILDLVLKVETENLEPGQFQDGYAILKVHETSDQTSPVLYQGSDEITIVPPQ